MKKLLLVLCGLACASHATVTISNIRGEHVSHSDMTLKFDLSGDKFNDGSGNVYFGNLRVRWTSDGSSCLNNPNAHVYVTGYYPGSGTQSYARGNSTFQIILSGLYPAAAGINICPEVNDNNGNWYSAMGTVRLQSLPAIHPARPQLPHVSGPPAYRDTSSYTQVASSCANILNDFRSALARSTGTILTLPAGGTCTDVVLTPAKNQYRPDVQAVSGSVLSNSGGKMLMTITNHGYSEGQGLHFSYDGYNPGLPNKAHNWTCSGLDMGRTYYVHAPTTNSFQLTCDAPYSQNGDVMTYSDGAPTMLLYAPYPRTVGEVIVRTSTPDSQFAPPGTRVSTSWLPLMATFTRSPGAGTAQIFDSKSVDDSANYNLTGMVRFIGIHFEGPDTNSAYGFPISTEEDSDDIVVDRCVISGSTSGFPYGYQRGIQWFGSNMTIMGSLFQKLFNSPANQDNSVAGDAQHGNGVQAIEAGLGPGPYIFYNNAIPEYAGNFMHFSDDGNYTSADYNPKNNSGTIRKRWDYYIVRNYWQSPMRFAYLSPQSDGNKYGSRSPVEWKSGQRILLRGNVFDTIFHSVASAVAEFTSVDQWGISDVTEEYNTFKHTFSATQMGNSTEGGGFQSPPVNRFWVHDNILWDLDGNHYVGYNGTNSTAPYSGWSIQGLGDGEDQVYEHNLTFKMQGSVPVVLRGGSYAEGVAFRNNILFVVNGYNGMSSESFGTFPGVTDDSCFTSTGQAFLTCHYPGIDYSGNVLISDSLTQSAVQSLFGDSAWRIPSDPTNYAAIGWTNYSDPVNPNFQLRFNSPYVSGGSLKGTDGRDVGPDIDAVEAAQGRVKAVVATNITNTSASITFLAPDSDVCPVDYSSSDPTIITSFLRVNDAGGDRSRNVTISGLAAHTTYYYRVNCVVEQPIGVFRTK